MSTVRFADLFCGIGGLTQSFEDAATILKRNVEAVSALDISSVCINTFNMNQKPVAICRSMEHMSGKDLKGAEFILMSPPCQPYTKAGKRMAEEDPRSHGMSHLLLSLREKRLNLQLRGLLLENVVPFRESETARMVIETLRDVYDLEVEHFVLSPHQYGIPNTRPRYYIVAYRRETGGGVPCPKASTPPIQLSLPAAALELCRQAGGLGSKSWLMKDYLEPRKDEEYMDDVDDFTPRGICHCGVKLAELLLPRERVEKLSVVRFEIANFKSRLSSSFTGGYGQLLGKSGPVLALKRVEGPTQEGVGNSAEVGDTSVALEVGAEESKEKVADGGLTTAVADKKTTDDMAKDDMAKDDMAKDDMAKDDMAKDDMARDKKQPETANKRRLSREEETSKRPRLETTMTVPPQSDSGSLELVNAYPDSGEPSTAEESVEDRIREQLDTGKLDPWRFRCVEASETLRHLCPCEILKIHGFPASFRFPEGLPLKKQWRLIGNSVSIPIVTVLLVHVLGKLTTASPEV